MDLLKNKIKGTGNEMFFSSSSKNTKKKKFTKAYDDYYALIFNLLHKRTNCREDAEDICHNLFTILYKKIDQVEHPLRWLHKAVKLELLAYYRKKGGKPDEISIDDVNTSELQSKVKDNEIPIIIREAVANQENYKSEREETLFRLIAINKYSVSEAASELNITRRQAEYSYNRTVQRFLNYLKSKGISPGGEF